MGKVRARKETGKLYLDFMCEGHRCREQTALLDTPANRKRVEALLQKVEAKILLGAFNYAEQFPDSRNLNKLKNGGSGVSDAGVDPEIKVAQTPYFADFADQWFQESKIQWRSSHTRNVVSILDSSLKPAFKNIRIAEITKADILAARTRRTERKWRD